MFRVCGFNLWKKQEERAEGGLAAEGPTESSAKDPAQAKAQEEAAPSARPAQSVTSAKPCPSPAGDCAARTASAKPCAPPADQSTAARKREEKNENRHCQ